MAQQIPLDASARAHETVDDEGAREIAPDLAYLRLLIVNVVLVGPPRAGDRGWVLIDAGLYGTASTIKAAAAERFGAHARPAAIVMTHGHFDHTGVLEDLAQEWDVPVYAHELEMPYLNGSASYPPPDPRVGGGLMALSSPIYPTAPVNVGSRLRVLPAGGSVPPMPGWRWIHTPGHSAGHVSFFRNNDRALIAGDAFITTAQESAYAAITQSPEMHGPPMYFTPDWQAARESVRKLAALEPELAVTGHGRAMQGPEMRDALHRLARDFDDVAVPKHGRYAAEPARAADGSAYCKA
jgi:glyoxylase-like metal-dependent hydrolase (beta-lactamase superfamily II)